MRVIGTLPVRGVRFSPSGMVALLNSIAKPPAYRSPRDPQLLLQSPIRGLTPALSDTPWFRRLASGVLLDAVRRDRRSQSADTAKRGLFGRLPRVRLVAGRPPTGRGA